MFHTRACAGLTPPSCRSPLGQSTGSPRASSRTNDWSPVSMVSICFRHVIGFTLVRLPSAHLTGSSRLFRNRSPTLRVRDPPALIALGHVFPRRMRESAARRLLV